MPPVKSFTSKRSINEQISASRIALGVTRQFVVGNELDDALEAARLAAEAAEEVVSRIEERIEERM